MFLWKYDFYAPFLCLCIVLFGEDLGSDRGAQYSRPLVRVTRRSHDLPSHVLVIASLLVSGARCIFVLPPPGPLHVFPFKYVLVCFMKDC